MASKKLKDRLYAYFTTRLGMFDYVRGWLKGDCPNCGRENKFGVNLSTNSTNCFICLYHEKPINVVSRIEGLDWQGTLKFLGTFEGLEYIEPTVIAYERKAITLPEGFTLLNQGDDTLARLAKNYIRGRGLDLNKLAYKGFGYCNAGPLFGYLVLPYYLKGNLVYYTTRRLLSIGPKFDNPSIETFGIGKSSLIYNLDALYQYPTVYVMESVFNAETVGDNCIALGGKVTSNWQISTILRSPVANLIILLDPDAYLYAIDLALQIINYKRVKVVNLPEGEDVNHWGRRNTLNRVWKTRYQDYKQLIKLRHDAKVSEYTHN